MSNYISPNQESKPTGSDWVDLSKRVGQIKWAWNLWLPTSFLTIVAAESGAGKSAFLLRLAGCFTNGWDFPDKSPFAQEQGCVLWCESEASQAMNVARAQEWGINLERFFPPLADPLQDINLDDKTHRKAIRDVAFHPNVRLIVIDSLSGANRQDENSSKMLQVVKWIAELARDTNKSIVLTHHLRKRGLQDGHEVALDRLRGSSSIIQAARVVIAIDKPNPNLPTKRLRVLKSNIGKIPEPIGFMVDEDGVQFSAAPREPERYSQKTNAKKLILELLCDGQMDATEMERILGDGGISESTMKIAKKELGVETKRIGGTNGKWVWELPKQT